MIDFSNPAHRCALVQMGLIGIGLFLLLVMQFLVPWGFVPVAVLAVAWFGNGMSDDFDIPRGMTTALGGFSGLVAAITVSLLVPFMTVLPDGTIPPIVQSPFGPPIYNVLMCAFSSLFGMLLLVIIGLSTIKARQGFRFLVARCEKEIAEQGQSSLRRDP